MYYISGFYKFKKIYNLKKNKKNLQKSLEILITMLKMTKG